MVDQVIMLGALAAVLLLGAHREDTRVPGAPVDGPGLTTHPPA
jgi:hypothetical protein